LNKSQIDETDIINQTYTAPKSSPPTKKIPEEPKQTQGPVKIYEINTRTQYLKDDFDLSKLNNALKDNAPTANYYTSLSVILNDNNLDLAILSKFNFGDQNTNSNFIELLEHINNVGLKKNIKFDDDAKLLADNYFNQFFVSATIAKVVQSDKSNDKLNNLIALRNLCYEYKDDEFQVALSKIRAQIDSSHIINIDDKKILMSMAKIMLKYNNLSDSSFNKKNLRENINVISKKLDKLSEELVSTVQHILINETILE